MKIEYMKNFSERNHFYINTILVVFILILFFCLSYPQEERGLDISGYFQSGVGIAHTIRDNALSNTFYAGKSTLRLNFANKDIEFAKFEGSIDFNILYGMYANLYYSQSNSIKIGEETVLAMDVRKLYLMLKPDFCDLYIGRQLIKFGEGFVFSPLNPFSIIDFTDINFTRPGVDGVRIKFPFSEMGYFEAITLPRSDFTNSDIATRLGFNAFEWDFSFAGYYRGKYGYTSAGFSFKGDAILGVYGEFVYHYKDDETKRFYNLMIGGDYSFLDKFIVRMEYYYHCFDTDNLSALELANSPVYPFVSKQYLMAQIVFSPTLIDSFSLSYIDNLESDSGLLLFLYQRNLYQNVNLLFNVRYSLKDLTGIGMVNFDLLYYSLEFQILY